MESFWASFLASLLPSIVALLGAITLWIRSNVVERKLDRNTDLTAEAKEVAVKVERQTNGAATARDRLIDDHGKRIAQLEVEMVAIRSAVEGVGKNIDSTRHEMRGHLQTVVQQLALLQAKTVPPPTQPPKGDGQ